VESQRQAKDKVEEAGLPSRLRIGVAESRAEQKVNGDGDEQKRNHLLQEVGPDDLDDESACDCPERGEHDADHTTSNQPGTMVMPRRARGAEDRLQLVR